MSRKLATYVSHLGASLGALLAVRGHELTLGEAMLAGGDAGEAEYKFGQVMAVKFRDSVSGAAVALDGNTGDGAIASVTTGVAAIAGVYEVRCTAAPDTPGANDAVFSVTGPDGALASATQGAAYDDGGLQFTIGAADQADFIIGDGFDITVTVAEATQEFVPLDPDASDGTEIAAAILTRDVTAPAGVAVPAVLILTDALIVQHMLAWPDGITATQQSRALYDLRNRGIVVSAAV